MLRLLTLIVLLAVVAAPGMAADSGPARSAALSAATLANDAGVPAGRFFQNRNYNYELVERTGSAILHHWFDYQAGEWRRGARFGSSVSGQPVFLQDASSTNNYELVVYEAGSRVRHYTFSMASGSWQRRTAFGTNVRGDPVMFQNRYNGNYEVVVKEEAGCTITGCPMAAMADGSRPKPSAATSPRRRRSFRIATATTSWWLAKAPCCTTTGSTPVLDTGKVVTFSPSAGSGHR